MSKWWSDLMLVGWVRFYPEQGGGAEYTFLGPQWLNITFVVVFVALVLFVIYLVFLSFHHSEHDEGAD